MPGGAAAGRPVASRRRPGPALACRGGLAGLWLSASRPAPAAARSGDRTTLALDAAGLAVIRYAPTLAIGGAREGVGIVLVLLGAVTAGASYRRYVRVTRAMRAGQPLPVTSLPRMLSLSLFVLSLGVGILLLVDRLGG